MKKNNLSYLLFILCFTVSCNSISNEIKGAFNTVNKSIDKSNSVVVNSNDELYLAIYNLKENNINLALKADALYLNGKNAIAYIDSIKKILNNKDTTGTKTDIAFNLLNNNKVGDKLKAHLLLFKTNANQCVSDAPTMLKIDEEMKIVSVVIDDSNWKSAYFKSVPTVGAITILNKMKNECNNVLNICLNKIYLEIK